LGEGAAAWSLLNLVMSTGGCGGFFASVRAIGVTGQQQQAKSVSAEDAVRGGAGGFCGSRGGGTKPSSSDPSPAAITDGAVESNVPEHKVAAKAVPTNFFTESFIFYGFKLLFALPLDKRIPLP